MHARVYSQQMYVHLTIYDVRSYYNYVHLEIIISYLSLPTHNGTAVYNNYYAVQG